MKVLRFYEYFASAYGTLWLFMLLVAFTSQSHINAGEFGLIGFPAISLVYAIVRLATDKNSKNIKNNDYELIRLKRRIESLENQTKSTTN